MGWNTLLGTQVDGWLAAWACMALLLSMSGRANGQASSARVQAPSTRPLAAAKITSPKLEGWTGSYQGYCIQLQVISGSNAFCSPQGDIITYPYYVDLYTAGNGTYKGVFAGDKVLISFSSSSSLSFDNYLVAPKLLNQTSVYTNASAGTQQICVNAHEVDAAGNAVPDRFAQYTMALMNDSGTLMYVEEAVYTKTNINQPQSCVPNLNGKLFCDNNKGWNYQCRAWRVTTQAVLPHSPKEGAKLVPTPGINKTSPTSPGKQSPSPPPPPGVIPLPDRTVTQDNQTTAGGGSGGGSSSSSHVGTIVGVAVGVAAAVIVAAALLAFWMRKRGVGPFKRGKSEDDDIMPPLTSVKAQPEQLPIDGIVSGDPFLKATAWQFSWTEYQLNERSQRVEAGITDTQLDRQLRDDGCCPSVYLTCEEVRSQIQILSHGLLGRGGAALVFMCRWPSRFGPDALLAIKVLKDAYDTPITILQSFEYEARLLSNMRHPNVATLYGHCLELPTVCLIMELMPSSLEALLYPEADTALHRGLRTSNTIMVTNNRWASTGNTGDRRTTTTSYGGSSSETEHRTSAAGTTPSVSQDGRSYQALPGTEMSVTALAVVQHGEQPQHRRQQESLTGAGSQAMSTAQAEPLTMLRVLQIAADVAAGLAYLHNRYVDGDQNSLALTPSKLPLSSGSSGGPSEGGSAPLVSNTSNSSGMSGDVLTPLAEARAAKVVHRDLKPANVLISSTGTAKLSDFGLARENPTTTVHTMHVGAGTLAYMAPELLAAKDAFALAPTNRCDIYSMGVMIWELVARKKPWSGMSQAQTIASVCSGMRPPIPNVSSAIDEDAPTSPDADRPLRADWARIPASFDAAPELVGIIQKCWRQREHKRPPAAEVHTVLQRMLEQAFSAQRTSTAAIELSTFAAETQQG